MVRGGCKGGGEPQRNDRVQEGGVQGLPEPGGGGTYEGGPLGSALDNHAPANIEQQVE